MPAQGRKNVHGKTGVRFKAAYTSSKRKMMLRNTVTHLVLFDQVKVTKAVAKDLIPLADKLITLAKTNTLASRRRALSILTDQQVGEIKAINKLFDVLGPRFKDRNGGYTRALDLAARRGDNAPMSVVTFVE